MAVPNGYTADQMRAYALAAIEASRADAMTDDYIQMLAHRKAWRYRKSSDPHHSDSYTFNKHTLIDFARAIEAHGIAAITAKSDSGITAQGGV